MPLACPLPKHTQDECARVTGGVIPGEPARYLIHQRVQTIAPAFVIYSQTRGRRWCFLVFTGRESCPGNRFYPRKHASQPHQKRSRRVGGWRGGEWFGCRSGRSCLGFPRGQLSLRPWPVSLPFPAPARQTVHAVVGLEIECAHQNARGVTGHVSQSRPAIPDGRISRVRF
jgi:hypothetical protein